MSTDDLEQAEIKHKLKTPATSQSLKITEQVLLKSEPKH